MGFRFWKRIRIAPGITLNLSKSGGSLSFGARGAKITIGPKGKRATIGLPGTGLFYTTTFGSKRRRKEDEIISYDHPKDQLTLGFFKRLITPSDEKAFVDGLRELSLGNEDKAFEFLKQAEHIADSAYLTGFIALKKGLLDSALNFLLNAKKNHKNLGRYFSKYGISATLKMPITEEISAYVSPDIRGVLLGLVEIYQRKGKIKEAIECLEKLQEIEPEDIVVKVSFSELLFDAYPNDKRALKKILELSKGIENETPIHTALLLYRARALRKLNLLDASKKTLTEALRRKKGRPEELIKALKYERALVYLDLGKKRLARSELEKLYAQDPDYEDVAERLGL